MIGTTRRDPTVIRNTIPESKMAWLGEPIGGYQYATFDDNEYAVDLGSSTPGDYTPGNGERIVMRVVREEIDGSAIEHHRTHRAFRVTNGTYASLVAKARKATPHKPMRSWDNLAGLPVMQHREPQPVLTGPLSSFMLGAWKAEHGTQGPMPVIEVGGNRPPERTPQGVIDYLASHEVELTVKRGHLVARSRKPISVDDRQLIEHAEALLVGHLTGVPVPCCVCDEPATSTVYPRAPMCAGHLAG